MLHIVCEANKFLVFVIVSLHLLLFIDSYESLCLLKILWKRFT